MTMLQWACGGRGIKAGRGFYHNSYGNPTQESTVTFDSSAVGHMARLKLAFDNSDALEFKGKTIK